MPLTVKHLQVNVLGQLLATLILTWFLQLVSFYKKVNLVNSQNLSVLKKCVIFFGNEPITKSVQDLPIKKSV
jgi:hypothetical protein